VMLVKKCTNSVQLIQNTPSSSRSMPDGYTRARV
jgi:hypothetical protein